MSGLIFATLKLLLSKRARLRTEEIYRSYHVILQRRCRRILRDETMAEDAMQEIFWTISRSVEQYKGAPEEILPWLYRITTTHCLKMIEKEQRWSRNIGLALEEGCVRYASCLTSGELEAKLVLGELFGKLPPSQQQVVMFRYGSGMTQEEIAEVMEVSRDEVRVLLKRFDERSQQWREERGQ